MAKKHIHKYHKVPLNFTGVWACALPNCTHYMPKHIESMVEGKASICWECGKNFVLDSESMKSDKPTCSECRNPVPEPKLDLTRQFSEAETEDEKNDIVQRLAEVLKGD